MDVTEKKLIKKETVYNEKSIFFCLFKIYFCMSYVIHILSGVDSNMHFVFSSCASWRWVMPLLTLADVVAAVSRLKGLSGVTRAAAKLHLRTLGRDPEHRAVSHVAAAETVKGKESVFQLPQDVIVS